MRVTVLFATSLVTLGACATKSQTGAVVGAAGGAVAGGVIGKVAGSTAKGAIIGAVVGGIAGTIIGAQMDKQAKEMEQTIKGATIERVGEGIQVTFASGLLYDFDSDVVRPEAKTNLRELAASLTKYPDTELLIIGHTDQLGSSAYNQELSERRSNAAATYLISQGVSGTRIGTRGLGETEPVATNDTEAGRQANRRVEVAIFASKEAREAAKSKQP
jgi:outer membrane protein OmpA-like peptidoglycan-associated protein